MKNSPYSAPGGAPSVTHFDSPVPSGVTPAPRYRDRDAAEDRVCRAIAALGRLAAVEVDQGEGPDDMDGFLIQAAYECHFDDPQCLGGAGCFRAAATPADVRALAAMAGTVTRGLMRYLQRRASGATLAAAHAQRAVVDDALAWLAWSVDGR